MAITPIRTSELRTVARSRGWKGNSKEGSNRELLVAWLESRGVTMEEAARIIKQLRDFARGGSLPAGGGTSGPSMDSIMQAVDARLANAATSSIDEKLLAKMVAEAVGRATPGKIILESADAKPVKISKRTHPMFEKVLRLVRAGLNVLLQGPAGCGKTTLAAQIAEALKRDYGTLHCTSGVSESHLTGWLLPIGKGNGAFEYVPSEFVTLYENGNSVFLLDEIDAADANMLLVLNGAMANGHLHVPHRFKAPHVERGKNCSIIAAANTFGTGADMMYAGRNQLDAATLDRFYVVKMDYDPALEAELMGQPVPPVAPWHTAGKETLEADIAELNRWVGRLRQRVAENRLRRVVSTRTYMKAITARQAGLSVAEIKVDLLSGWTRDELNKIGEEAAYV